MTGKRPVCFVWVRNPLLGKKQTWSVAKAQRKHAAQGIQSIHPFINPYILLAITLISQEVTI